MLAAVYKSINLGKVGERMVDISTEKLEELENEVTSQNTKLKKMEEFVSPDKLYQELIQSVRKISSICGYFPDRESISGSKRVT